MHAIGYDTKVKRVCGVAQLSIIIATRKLASIASIASSPVISFELSD